MNDFHMCYTSCKTCYVAEILVNIDYPYVLYSFSKSNEKKLKSSIKYEIYWTLFIRAFLLNLPLLFIDIIFCFCTKDLEPTNNFVNFLLKITFFYCHFVLENIPTCLSFVIKRIFSVFIEIN